MQEPWVNIARIYSSEQKSKWNCFSSIQQRLNSSRRKNNICRFLVTDKHMPTTGGLTVWRGDE